MHICHVITRLIVGGAQENTLLSCEGLHARGHRVTLVSGPTVGREGSLVARAKSGGYSFVELPELIRAVNPWYDARCRRELRRLFDQFRPDVVHTHSSKAGILGRLAADDAEVPLVVHTIHGMSFNRTQPAIVRWTYAALERYAARRTHAIVTVADAMIEQTVAAGVCPRGKLRTVYSAMETERFNPALHERAAVRRRWGLAEDAVVIGTVARLFRKKGYEQLLPILREAAAREPRLRFVWVGDGAQRGEYESRLSALGLRDKTTLTGLVPPEAIPDLLSGMDVLGHTSQWEGLPRAVVQALLMQVPVVAFRIDGTPEVVLDGQTGLLADLGDDRQFVDHLLKLAGDETLRQSMGSRGRDHCIRRFGVATMVKALDDLYAELWAAHCGGAAHSPKRAR